MDYTEKQSLKKALEIIDEYHKQIKQQQTKQEKTK